MRHDNNISSPSSSATTILTNNTCTTTVFRSCTEFSHEHSKHPLASATIVSKLLIQPAHFKSNSVSHWPSQNRRNSGVTLLHACEHFSILPTMPNENKQLITSPSNLSCCYSPPKTIPFKKNQKSNSPTKMHYCNNNTSNSPSLQQQQQQQTIPSFSPNSGCSNSSPTASTGSISNRPLRVAQPPPLSITTTTTQLIQPTPCTSFPVSSSNGFIPKQQNLQNTIHSLPTSNYQNKQKQQQFPINSSSNQKFSHLSYSELLELARNRQRQIEANEAELDERRKAVALFGVARRTAGSEREQQQNAQILMSNIRSQIDRDEKELARLSFFKREANKLREYNIKQSKELKQLELDYSNNEKELLKVVAKVDSLRGQLENLYMKRATKNNSEQKYSSSSPKEKTEIHSNQNEGRPKASVSPFNKYEKGYDIPDCSGITTINHSPVKNNQIQTNSTFGNGTTKIQWRKELPSNNNVRQQQINVYNNIQQQQQYLNIHSSLNGSTNGLLPPAVDKISLRRNSINQAKRNSLVGEGGGDEHVQALLLAELRRGRSHISFGRSWDSSQLSDEFRITKREGEEERIEEEILNNNNNNQNTENTELINKTIETQNKQENNSIDLIEYQQPSQLNFLQQQKIISPKTSPKRATLPIENNIDAFNKIFNKQEPFKSEKEIDEEREELNDKKEEEDNKLFIEIKEGKENEEEYIKKEEEEKEIKNDYNNKTIKLIDNLFIKENENKKEEKEKEISCNEVVITSSPPLSDSSTVSSTELEREGILELFDDSWHKNICPLGIKGILRERQQQNNLTISNSRLESKKQSNRVKIDLVVLFLDVAYEGQYEMLVQLASQIDDISVSNSEGLTALHYAICASNHDIVQFLVENGADVNALDVDGWTPLHCAASCGNLPMIKLLIEYGACPIATTISKSETVAQIFDDSNENASMGIEYMAFIEECMGVVNDTKVYAAYSYDQQREDELSFEEGDELKVICKCEHNIEENDLEIKEKEEKIHSEEECDEQCWWLCEHTKDILNNNNNRRGFVPRNYLALFPTLKHRNKFIIDFKLPKEIIFNEQNNEEEEEEEENLKTLKENNEEGINNNILRINENNNKNSFGHQELSTYA